MSATSRFILALTALVLLVSAPNGCASESHQPTPDASARMDAATGPARPVWTTPTAGCDPLAAHELPIQLGTVIAAGKDEHGTIDAVDRDPSGSDERVFVSRGETLYRKRDTGSGASGSSDFTWSFDDDGTPERLVVKKQGDEVTDIALAPPNEKTFIDQLDDRAQKLTPLDPHSLAG